MIMDNEGVISSCVWAVGQMGYEVSLMVGQNQLDNCQKINTTDPDSNQIYLVTLRPRQLEQASFLQKNQTLQNVFLISVTLRWHRASVACKNQSL